MAKEIDDCARGVGWSEVGLMWLCGGAADFTLAASLSTGLGAKLQYCLLNLGGECRQMR